MYFGDETATIILGASCKQKYYHKAHLVGG